MPTRYSSLTVSGPVWQRSFRPGQPFRRPDPPVLRDETELHVDSFAKKAAAFLRMSRSALSLATSIAPASFDRGRQAHAADHPQVASPNCAVASDELQGLL